MKTLIRKLIFGYSVRGLKAQRGVVFLLSLVIMAVIIGVGLTISNITVSEIQFSEDTGKYVPALYLADAGIEQMLYRVRARSIFDLCASRGTENDSNCDATLTLSGNPPRSYDAHIYKKGGSGPSGNCPASSVENGCIFSRGIYNGLMRKIQVSF